MPVPLQDVPHAPALQTYPWGHALPQLPQLPVSLCRSTQLLPQTVCGAAQPQTPAVHERPGSQTLPQNPQLWESLERVTHCPPQLLSFAGQIVVWDEVQETTRTAKDSADAALHRM